MIFFLFVVLLLGITADQAISQVKPKQDLSAASVDPGSIEGNVYTNRSLGIRIRFPSKMVVETQQEHDTSIKEGVEIYKEMGGRDQKAVEALAQRERSLFGISTPEAEDEPIASLSLSAMKDTTTVDLEAMVDRTVKMWTSAPNVTLVKPAKKVEFSGLVAYTAELSMQMRGVTVSSTIYSMRRNGHLLTFGIVHTDDRGRDVMERVLKDIELF